MHRAINIKHRVVRRVDIEIAPLATFDTIDLGDEDEPIKKSLSDDNDLQRESQDDCTSNGDHVLVQCHTCFTSNIRATEHLLHNESVIQTRTIGGNTSKKSLTQAGGDKNQKEAGGLPSGAPTSNTQHGDDKAEDLPEQSNLPAPEQSSSPPCNEIQTAIPVCETQARRVPYDRQGSLGRVSLPVRQPDSPSSSSSSSPESRSDNTFTFHTLKAEASHLQLTCTSQGSEPEDKHDSLVPEIPEVTDPSQILSPSKRKAYERRIERLKVTTSPIARPRSTTPINVVTLDEYAAISSPDASPASPSVLQDKLKITLPADEFTAKPKTPKHHSGRRSLEDTVFHFSEDTLFSRSKSALLVEGDGNLPLSPRRVLLPPTLTPISSPKLSASPRLTKPVEAESIPPTISFSQQKTTTHKFFGETVDEVEEENWADFPEPSPTIEAPPSVLIPGLYSNTATLESSSFAQPSVNIEEKLHQNTPDITVASCNYQSHNSTDTPSQPLSVLPVTNQIPNSTQCEIKQKETETHTETASPESDLNSQTLETAGISNIDVEPSESHEASLSQNRVNPVSDDFGHESTKSSQESSENSQADLSNSEFCADYVLQEVKNYDLLTDIETKGKSASPDSRESSNRPASVVDTSSLVHWNKPSEESPSDNIVGETSIVKDSQRSPLDETSQPAQATHDRIPNTNPFLTSPVSQSNVSISVDTQYNTSFAVSQGDSQLQQEYEPTVHVPVLEDNKPVDSKQQNLQSQDSSLKNFLPQLTFPHDSQSKTTDLQEDFILQHTVLQDSHPQLSCVGDFPSQNSLQGTLVPHQKDSQLEQTLPQHAQLEDFNLGIVPSAESTDAVPAVLPSVCPESDLEECLIGGLGSISEDSVKSELDKSSDLPGHNRHPSSAIDLAEDTNPFSVTASLGQPPVSVPSSIPHTSHSVLIENPVVGSVVVSPALLSMDDNFVETADPADCAGSIDKLEA